VRDWGVRQRLALPTGWAVAHAEGRVVMRALVFLSSSALCLTACGSSGSSPHAVDSGTSPLDAGVHHTDGGGRARDAGGHDSSAHDANGDTRDTGSGGGDAGNGGGHDASEAGPPAFDAGVYITVDRSQDGGTSQLMTGYSQIDNSLQYPWTGNSETAVDSALALLKPAIGAYNQFIMAWGAADPWPTESDAPDLSSFTGQLNTIQAQGGELIVSLCEAPWWMKGQLQADGSTTLLTEADDFADIAYSSRVLDNMMSEWVSLVQTIAKTAMAPPYNVRRFQVWNELKGYYDPATNAWDYDDSAGDPSGPNATHGYTFFYNQTYAALKSTATGMGITASDVWVGGPYVVMESGQKASIMSNPSSVTGPWGVLDQRALDVVTYWLANKTGGEFVTVDGSPNVSFGDNPTDDFTMGQKFADVDAWIRTQPGGASLPIFWAEWYDSPVTLPSTPEAFGALKGHALAEHVRGGSSVALIWGGLGIDGPSGVDGLYTPTTSADGGAPLPLMGAVQDFHTAFPPGTALVKATASNDSVDVLASAAHTLLINETGHALTVSVNGTAATLAPYQVSLIPTP
jgi:hypothetical protein